MKTNLLLLALLLSGYTLQSCNNDDDNLNSGNAAVENAFVAKYAGAAGVDWETKGAYYVVDFWLNNQEMEAWFGQSGEWYYTETDMVFDQLPEAVKTAFNQSEYSGWHIDDIDMVERNGMEVVYVLEVEQGNQEYDLYFTADGTLVKAVLDSNNNNDYLPTNLPESISSYLSSNHPNARIVEVDIEDGNYELDIIENNKHLELQFTTAGSWVYTKTEDLLQSEVPQNVLAALQSSEYGAYRIDDIDYYLTPTGSYYLFELGSGSTEVDVKVTAEGVVERAIR